MAKPRPINVQLMRGAVKRVMCERVTIRCRFCLRLDENRVATDQGKVRENTILFKVIEKSRSFVSGQGISASLYKVSKKSGNFILRLPQII